MSGEDVDLRFRREILGVSILLILGSIFVVFPFLDAIILAAATAYLLRAGHRTIDRRLDNEFLSTAIIISSILGFFTLGTYFTIENSAQIIRGIDQISINFQQNLNNALSQLNIEGNFRAQLTNFVDTISESIRLKFESAITSFPSIFIDLGIYLVTSIYLYKDSARIKKKTYSFIQNLPDDEEKIIKSLIQSVDSIFRGVFLTQVIVAAILAAVSAIGFYAISFATTSIPFIPLWAFLIGIAALMPIFAAFMIYGPIAIYYILFGAPVKGSLLLIFGVIVLNILPEIFLRPYVGSRRLDEHPLIIFLGFIAGPLTLGLKGLIVGPVLLILSKEFMLNYSEIVSSEKN